MPGVLKVLMWPGPPDHVISKPPMATTSDWLALKAATLSLYSLQSFWLDAEARLMS